RLPVTFYKSVEQLPPFEDYRMEGKTYRYFKGEPLYPFGYGLSYTTFKYDNLKLDSRRYTTDQNVELSVEVQNTGARAGDEVVQLYLTDVASSVTRPVKELKGFERVTLAPGERRRVEFALGPAELGFYDRSMRYTVEPGAFRVMVGASSASGLEANFEVTGR
ncbi:MAG TPA: fibronectin type III-like domain-contianing protein, partial [Pyrinomonadaceae bacterium]|nr:fibronectin type III-like domain-contianing protein [Pyrinomonadaceae bacterium]